MRTTGGALAGIASGGPGSLAAAARPAGGGAVTDAIQFVAAAKRSAFYCVGWEIL